MTDITPNQGPKPGQRPAFYSLLAIGIAVLFVVQVVSMNFAFHANDDFLYGEVVKGPNPVAGFISITLLYIGFFALPIIYIAILYCIVLSIKGKQKLLNITISTFAFVLVLFIAHPVFLLPLSVYGLRGNAGAQGMCNISPIALRNTNTQTNAKMLYLR